ARATAWVFAALNSVEPFIMGLIDVDIFSREAPWAKESRPHKEAMVKKRLSDLAQRLAGRDWLEDRFTAGDLMMATVLHILRPTDLMTSDPTLAPYLARCEARPAFQKALADQLASFKEVDHGRLYELVAFRLELMGGYLSAPSDRVNSGARQWPKVSLPHVWNACTRCSVDISIVARMPGLWRS